MIEPLDGMPPGTLGFRATEVRMVLAVGAGFEAFEPGALLEDTKAWAAG